MAHSITLTAPLSFDASADGALPKRMRGIAYSGARVPDRNLVIDLSTITVVTPAPLLANHDRSSPIGRIERATVGTDISIEADLYSDIDEMAAGIAKKAARGHPWQLSIGVFDYSSEYVPPGSTVTVNGREFDGPIEVARHGKVRETSVVSLGADYDTTTSFFQSNDRSLPMADVNAAGIQLATLTVERDSARARVTELEAADKASKARVTELEAELAILRTRAEAAEREQRLSDVRAFFKEAGIEFSDDAAKPYLLMPSETFVSVRDQVIATIKPRLPQHLSQSFADSGARQGGQPAGGLLLQTVKSAHGIK